MGYKATRVLEIVGKPNGLHKSFQRSSPLTMKLRRRFCLAGEASSFTVRGGIYTKTFFKSVRNYFAEAVVAAHMTLRLEVWAPNMDP